VGIATKGYRFSSVLVAREYARMQQHLLAVIHQRVHDALLQLHRGRSHSHAEITSQQHAQSSLNLSSSVSGSSSGQNGAMMSNASPSTSAVPASPQFQQPVIRVPLDEARYYPFIVDALRQQIPRAELIETENGRLVLEVSVVLG
jgi:hypothetical protein